MRKTIFLMLALLALPIVLAQSETLNQTGNETGLANQTAPWYDSYVQGILAGDTVTLITAVIGLLFVYIFGKLAFKFIKWAIIILLIILIFRLLF